MCRFSRVLYSRINYLLFTYKRLTNGNLYHFYSRFVGPLCIVAKKLIRCSHMTIQQMFHLYSILFLCQ